MPGPGLQLSGEMKLLLEMKFTKEKNESHGIRTNDGRTLINCVDLTSYVEVRDNIIIFEYNKETIAWLYPRFIVYSDQLNLAYTYLHNMA